MPSAHDWYADWFAGAFVHGFCVSLIRPGVLVFLFLVLCLRLGAGLGLPLLFWRPREMPKTAAGAPVSGRTRPNWLGQLFVGFGIGVLVWQVFLSGYLFEEFASNYTKDREPFCEVRKTEVGAGAPVRPPAFGGNEHGYPGRFRFDPHGLESMWLYAAAVTSGLIAIGLLAVSAAAAWWAVRRVYRRWAYPDWEPFAPKTARPSAVWRWVNRVVQLLTGLEPFPDKTDRTPIPYSPSLPAGVLVGLVVMSVLTAWLLGSPGGFRTDEVGERQIEWAGWGASETRQNDLRKQIRSELEARREVGAPPPADPASDRWGAREWLRPFFPVYGAFTANFVLIAVFSLTVMMLPLRLRAFTPAVGIVFLLNCALFLHVLLNYFTPVPAEFFVLLMVLAVLFAGRAYKLKFPHMEAYYARPVSLPGFDAYRAAEEANQIQPDPPAVPAAPPPPAPLDDAPGAIALLDSRTLPYPHPTVASGRKPPLAIVCVSGGGSRAAAWTMKVLLEIEKAFDDPDQFWALARPDAPAPAMPPVAFPYHTRLVTGASGGMIAAAYYVASLAAPDGPAGLASPNSRSGVKRNARFSRRAAPGAAAGRPLTRAELFDGVCEDFLTPVVHALVSRDLPSLLLPFHTSGTDRGRTIEIEWERALHGQLDRPFCDLAAGEAAGWRPSIVLSPMMVEDGRQLFISNLDLAAVVQNRAELLGEVHDPAATGHCSGVRGNLNPKDGAGRRLLSREGLEFFKLFPQAREFRLSTGVRMSASFPYVMPAVPLPTNPPRRVVDAGYYDNYGVGIAASWLFNHMEWVREHTSGVVVIQIRDGASGESRRRECVFDPFPTVSAAGLHWATSPPKGLWNFRTAAHTFRNDNLLHLLDNAYRTRHTDGRPWFGPGFITTVTFELQQGDDVALNFTLSESERRVIVEAVNDVGFRDQMVALLTWWHARPEPARREPGN